MSESPVDEALAVLLSLDDMEVADHRHVYEQIHQQLRRELESTNDPGPAGDSNA